MNVLGSSAAMTIGGANLVLSLGDSSADQVETSGDLTVGDDLSVEGVMNAGNAAAPLAYHRIGSGTTTIPAAWSTYTVDTPDDLLVSGDLDVTDWLWSGTHINRGNFIGFIGNDDLLETSIYWSTLADPDRLVIASDTQVVRDLYLEGVEQQRHRPEHLLRGRRRRSGQLHPLGRLDGRGVRRVLDDHLRLPLEYRRQHQLRVDVPERQRQRADPRSGAVAWTSTARSPASVDATSPSRSSAIPTSPPAPWSASTREELEAVREATRAYDPMLVGVVSTQPSLLMAGPAADAYPVRTQYEEAREAAAHNPGRRGAPAGGVNDLELALDTWARGEVAGRAGRPRAGQGRRAGPRRRLADLERRTRPRDGDDRDRSVDRASRWRTRRETARGT